ncbi:hypothetical protein KC359_g221 [Hortaea werneckii]|nr:hypothetical protein KC359_g221 [Hortaea werneckii]
MALPPCDGGGEDGEFVGADPGHFVGVLAHLRFVHVEHGEPHMRVCGCHREDRNGVVRLCRRSSGHRVVIRYNKRPTPSAMKSASLLQGAESELGQRDIQSGPLVQTRMLHLHRDLLLAPPQPRQMHLGQTRGPDRPSLELGEHVLQTLPAAQTCHTTRSAAASARRSVCGTRSAAPGSSALSRPSSSSSSSRSRRAPASTRRARSARTRCRRVGRVRRRRGRCRGSRRRRSPRVRLCGAWEGSCRCARARRACRLASRRSRCRRGGHFGSSAESKDAAAVVGCEDIRDRSKGFWFVLRRRRESARE